MKFQHQLFCWIFFVISSSNAMNGHMTPEQLLDFETARSERMARFYLSQRRINPNLVFKNGRVFWQGLLEQAYLLPLNNQTISDVLFFCPPEDILKSLILAAQWPDVFRFVLEQCKILKKPVAAKTALAPDVTLFDIIALRFEKARCEFNFTLALNLNQTLDFLRAEGCLPTKAQPWLVEFVFKNLYLGLQ